MEAGIKYWPSIPDSWDFNTSQSSELQHPSESKEEYPESSFTKSWYGSDHLESCIEYLCEKGVSTVMASLNTKA